MLYDVKSMTLSLSYYRVPRQDRGLRRWGVRKRELAVPGRYEAKAREVYRGYNGTSRDETGPVEHALAEFEVQGLVVGAFGEVSRNVEALKEHAHCRRDGAAVERRRQSIVPGGYG